MPSSCSFSGGDEPDVLTGGLLAGVPLVGDHTSAWSLRVCLLALFIMVDSLGNADIIELHGESKLVVFHPMAAILVNVVLSLWDGSVFLGGLLVNQLALGIFVDRGVVFGWFAR